MTVSCKTFDAYIKELIYYPRRSPKWLADKRLTLHEKKILQGYLLIRNNKSSQIISEYKNTQKSDIEFVHDHWNLLLGICYNNIGNFTEAEKHLKQAIISFEKQKFHYHHFTALFNYILLLSNSGRINEMGPVIKKMEEICPSMQLAKIRLLRCQFIFACDTNEDTTARELIHSIDSIKSKMSESDMSQHLICEFMFYIKHEDLDSAQKCIETMKKFRNYSSSENFQFMRTLLSHLMNNTTIYAYENDFPSMPILFWQLKVIESLQGLDQKEANRYWDKLEALMPHIYKKDFYYDGEKCLFSLCLEKHKQNEIMPLKVNNCEGPQHHQVYQILQAAEAPIQKGHLFELIYNEAPQSKDDILKLAKLISKVRSIYAVEIVSRKGTYFIEKEIKKVPSKKMG